MELVILYTELVEFGLLIHRVFINLYRDLVIYTKGYMGFEELVIWYKELVWGSKCLHIENVWAYIESMLYST